MADRQRATAMYFIDRLALRAGNEKGEDEADTVGCCSLRCEHVTLEPPNTIIFDFLGKDSIRFFKDVQVEAQVFKNIRIFKENKEAADALFDRVNVSGGCMGCFTPRNSCVVISADVHDEQTP
jgi:DNA topoisomerase-1